MAVVNPQYKKGDKFDSSNYRHISLLQTFAKIFEKVKYSRLSANADKKHTGHGVVRF